MKHNILSGIFFLRVRNAQRKRIFQKTIRLAYKQGVYIRRLQVIFLVKSNKNKRSIDNICVRVSEIRGKCESIRDE